MRRSRSPPGASVVVVIKFVLKVVILAAVFYARRDVFAGTDVLPGLQVDPNPNGPLGEFGTYLWIALLFGVVNAIVGPILRLLSLPFVVLTLGLFLLVVNAALLGPHGRCSPTGCTSTASCPRSSAGSILAIAGWVADQLLDR